MKDDKKAVYVLSHWVGDGIGWETVDGRLDLEDFIEANVEGMSPETEEALLDLEEGEEFISGGGAGLAWRVLRLA